MRRGYRSGGSDLNIPRQFVSQFDPEFTLNYELALRSFWFDRALRVNANLFYTDWTDQQLVVSLSTLQQDEVGFNVGKSTLKGFEIDAAWTPSPNWFVQGALGYADTQFMDFDAALAEALIEAQSVAAPFDLEETLAAFSGREFAFAPRWSGAARIAYTADNGLFAVLGVTYEGESFVNNAQSASPTFLDNDARALVNLTAGYERDGVEIAFVAKNLFNETYVASGGDELVRLGAPRELGVQAKAAF
jgi:outer membrane receptor protein involved in Fe transport